MLWHESQERWRRGCRIILPSGGTVVSRPFFPDEDYQAYIDLMGQWCGRHGVETWAYCLMPSHIHLIAAPPAHENLMLAIGEAHRRYTAG